MSLEIKNVNPILAVMAALTAACFALPDTAYAFGRLLGGTAFIYVIAYFIARNRPEATAIKIKMIAAGVLLVTSGLPIINEWRATMTLNEVKANLNQQRDVMKSVLLDEKVTTQFKDVPADFSQFTKPAASDAELASDVKKLTDMSFAFTQRGRVAYEKKMESIQIEKLLTPAYLTDKTKVATYRAIASDLNAFLVSQKKDTDEFFVNYQAATKTIAANYPQALKNAESKFDASKKQIDQYFAVEMGMPVLIEKFGALFQRCLAQNACGVDKKTGQILMANDADIDTYNRLIDAMNKLAEDEEKVLKGYYDQLNEVSNKYK